MGQLNKRRIAILATNGFEQSELMEPKRQLADAGATVHVIGLDDETIRGWDGDDWGDSVDVDLALENANVDDYDGLVLPGGQINPDVLRTQEAAVSFVQDFARAGKSIAAICHAPWLLIEAGLTEGRRMTSYGSISTDVRNAGGLWEDSEVVVDDGVITSRQPEDLDAFCRAIVEEISANEASTSPA